MLFIDTITIGLWTTEESCPSDSFTAVITLNNFSHQLTHTAITLHLSESMSVNGTPSEGVEQEDNKLDEVLASTAGGTLASEAEAPETLNFIDTGDIA